jgi:hypothetical protein
VEVESEETGLESDEGEGMAGMEQREQLNEILDQPGWGFDEVREVQTTSSFSALTMTMRTGVVLSHMSTGRIT